MTMLQMGSVRRPTVEFECPLHCAPGVRWVAADARPASVAHLSPAARSRADCGRADRLAVGAGHAARCLARPTMARRRRLQTGTAAAASRGRIALAVAAPDGSRRARTALP